MTRIRRIVATLAVAGTLPASAIVAAQPPGPAPDRPPVEMPTGEFPTLPENTIAVAPPGPSRFADLVADLRVLPPGTTLIVEGMTFVQAPAEAKKADPPKEQAKVETAVGETTTTKTTTPQVAPPAPKADAAKLDDAIKSEVKAIQAAPARAAVRIVPRAVAAPPNIEPQVQRFVVQLRPLVRSEFHLLLSTCSPTPEQRAALLAEEDRVLKDVAREVAQVQMGVRMPNGTVVDPRKQIPETLARLVKERLTPEQAARYKAESDAKLDFSRKVARANLASSLDEELILSAEQRVRINQALESNWKTAWHGSVQTQLNANLMIPDLPDAVIHPILDPVQRQVWDKMRKTSANYFYGNYLPMGNFAIEEVDPPAPAVTPKPDASSK